MTMSFTLNNTTRVKQPKKIKLIEKAEVELEI